MNFIWIQCWVLVVAFPWNSAANDFGVNDFRVVSDASGRYSVHVNNETWLNSAPTFFRANGKEYSSSDGSLKLLNPPVADHGVDTLGPWNGNVFNYSLDGSSVMTSIRVYEKYSAAVFTQTFVSGLGQTSCGNPTRVISGFPSIHVGDSSSKLGYLAYDDFFIGWMGMGLGRWDKLTKRLMDGLKSGPLLLFDPNDHVLIISPFDQFMAASFWHNESEKTISWGIMGRVDSIRPDYTQSTVIFYDSNGVNQAIENWGALMRLWYDRKSSSRDMDLTVNYLGYYTDNGGYYYQVTEPGMNFEDTMIGVYNYSSRNRIPYRYLQYDDWFYPVTGPTSYGATVTWNAKPSVFPHGLSYIYNKTRLPVLAHNRYWSDKTPYARQNGGRFNFVFDGLGNALPDDQDFWDELFAWSKSWGLVTYEQDWLNYQIENIDFVQSDLSLATRWLRQMGEAAQRHGLTIQYCMALPRHLLASLEIPAVSQIRVSIDYMLMSDQYKIGLTSLFAHALGVAPFKDNFWTSRNQPGNRYHKTEDNARLQAIVSLLSTGPVGISDRINYTDLDLISRLSAVDGLLLKPSRPATAINAQILQSAFGGDDVGPSGEVWTTFSRISGFTFGIILAMNLAKPYALKVTDGNWGLQPPPSSPSPPSHSNFEFPNSIAYSSTYFMPSAVGPVHFNADSPLMLFNCSVYTEMCFYYTSPVFHIREMDIYIKGEMTKAVPVSPNRMKTMTVTSDDLSIEIAGTPSESVPFEICQLSNDDDDDDEHSTCIVYQCVISDDGKARLSLALGPNQCR